MAGKPSELINKATILFSRLLQLEIQCEIIIIYQWNPMNNYNLSFLTNPDWNMLISLSILIILFIEAKWKKLMKIYAKNYYKVITLVKTVLRVELFRIDFLQNVIVWKICKWVHQVEVDCMDKTVMNKWKIWELDKVKRRQVL